MISVAAAMIVRDEERFLPGCLSSLRGKVDDVVIVDTGSVDDTLSIARTFGARVFHFEWNDDFAAARNRGLEEVTADWMLYIDADERLHTPGDRPVAEFLDPDAIAAYVRFKPKHNYTSYREPRLFRRDPRLRFSGKIHESILPAIDHIPERDKLSIARTAISLDHLGYEGDQARKTARNIPLLRQAIEDDPNRVYYWYHLAESLAVIGRVDEALAVARRGLQAAQQRPSEKQRANASMIFQFLARIYLERGQDPSALIAEGLAGVPDDYALWFIAARDRLNAGEFEAARRIAEDLLSVDTDALSDGLLAFDQRIFEEFANDLAGVAAFRLGLFAEASRHFLSAAAAAPDNVSYRIKARAALLQQQRLKA
jgi:glycosyltransferase involved in cell wall biosynthesis